MGHPTRVMTRAPEHPFTSDAWASLTSRLVYAHWRTRECLLLTLAV